MSALPDGLAAQRERGCREQCKKRDRPVRAGRTQKIAGSDHGAGEQWQRLSALLVHGDDLRDDVEQERCDNGKRNDGDQRRIDERHREFLPQRLPRFEIVGEPRKNDAQLPGFGTHRHQTAIQLGERARKTRQRRRERLARRDLLADGVEHACRGRLIRLLGDGGERAIERHARRDQRCQLARDEREQRRGDSRRFRAHRAASGRGLDRGRKKAVSPELIAHRTRGRAFEQAPARPSRSVDSFEAEFRHDLYYRSDPLNRRPGRCDSENLATAVMPRRRSPAEALPTTSSHRRATAFRPRRANVRPHCRRLPADSARRRGRE